MKAAIHPNYKAITVTCSCGNTFETRSTLGQDLQIEVCSNCHPFYTGKQKILDTGGRVARFEARYAKAKATSELQDVSVESSILEIEQATSNVEAQSRLSELRAELGLDSPAAAPIEQPKPTEA